MTERLLQFIWQHQYYNAKELTTTKGEELLIIHAGMFNQHQGPDFLDGRIKLDGNVWAGNIELHINASDWHRHMHDTDPNYANVILHVVWNNDMDEEQVQLPTLLLGDRIQKLLIGQYESWMRSDHFIPCASMIGQVQQMILDSWKDRLLLERLHRKSKSVLLMLEKNNFHWDEMLWWMLARNFGLYVNADAFAAMAQSIPYSVLMKHRNQIQQLEALMMGQAGLLRQTFKDKYALMLQKEHVFLKKKYLLKESSIAVHFLRMRPACFPTVRLAQLAMFVHQTTGWLTTVLNCPDVKEVKKILNVTANDYWHYHFTFGEATVYQPKVLGATMINSIMVNTLVPVLYTYGEYKKDDRFKMKAVEWLTGIAAENNSTLNRFRQAGMAYVNAGESQALIELKSQYCDKRKCLECAIGNAVLKRSI
jgi:hypothetical protein